MEYLFIYLLQVVEFFSIFGIVLYGISFFCWMINCFKHGNGMPSTEKEVIKVPLIVLSIAVMLQLIPTKQTLLLIGGTYLGKKAVNAVITDEKIKKVDTIINLQLDKYIKELQTNN